MTDIVKGMARAYHEAYWNWMPALPRSMEDEAMRAALLWLAAEIKRSAMREVDGALSDTMSIAYAVEKEATRHTGLALSAAIRAAAGEEGK